MAMRTVTPGQRTPRDPDGKRTRSLASESCAVSRCLRSRSRTLSTSRASLLPRSPAPEKSASPTSAKCCRTNSTQLPPLEPSRTSYESPPSAPPRHHVPISGGHLPRTLGMLPCVGPRLQRCEGQGMTRRPSKRDANHGELTKVFEQLG